MVRQRFYFSILIYSCKSMVRFCHYASNDFNCATDELELRIRGTRRFCTFGLEWATVEVHFYFSYSSPSPLCPKFTSIKGYSKTSSEPTHNFCSRLRIPYNFNTICPGHGQAGSLLEHVRLSARGVSPVRGSSGLHF